MAKEKTVAQLREELAKKERELQKLLKKRQAMLAALGEVETAIHRLGGELPGARGARKGAPARRQGGGNGKTLHACLADVLKGYPQGIRVVDAVQAVQKAGYKSASDEFYTIVAAALRDGPEFKKVTRGVYKLA